MVPTDEAMITRQMLYSALPVPTTCAAFAILPPFVCSIPVQNHRYIFCKTALTVKSDPGDTVRSRFHSANPWRAKTTTCVPVLTPTSDGVLPTYLPSTVISAPLGVEPNLH